VKLASIVGCAFVVAVAVSACSSKSTSGGTQVEYTDSELGTWVRQDQPLKVTMGADGSEELVGEETVDVHGVDHQVQIDTKIMPIAMGGGHTLSVTDMTMSTTRTFAFDPMTNTITFSNGKDTATVTQNPDKTYSVNGQPAANGKAAVLLLKSSPVYNDIDTWSFVATYVRCQTCLELAASRAPVDCGGSSGTRGDNPPAVCDIFRDFCDCAECDKLGKVPCSKCP